MGLGLLGFALLLFHGEDFVQTVKVHGQVVVIGGGLQFQLRI